MEVTVKNLETGDCLHFILLIVGVASVAKCWRQKSPNFAFAGSCTLSEYFPSNLLCIDFIITFSTFDNFRPIFVYFITILMIIIIIRPRNIPDNVR